MLGERVTVPSQNREQWHFVPIFSLKNSLCVFSLHLAYQFISPALIVNREVFILSNLYNPGLLLEVRKWKRTSSWTYKPSRIYDL